MVRHLQDLKCLRIIHNNRITRRAVVSFNSFCYFQSLFQTLISKVRPSPILEMHLVPFFLSSSNVHYFNNSSSLTWEKGKLLTHKGHLLTSNCYNPNHSTTVSRVQVTQHNGVGACFRHAKGEEGRGL